VECSLEIAWVTLSGRRLVGAYERAAPTVLPACLCAAEGGGASESFEVPSLAGAWPFSREEWLDAMGAPLSLLGVSGLKVGGAAFVGEKLCIFAMW
jgi:hypothetical protein